MIFKRKNKQIAGCWIKREYLFDADKFECSFCHAAYHKGFDFCPNCRTKMTKVKYDPQWIDEMELDYDD